MDKLPDGLVTFGSLAVGDRFEFRDIRAASQKYNDVYGPFTKTARGTYLYADGVSRMPGTAAGYKVKKLPPR